MKQVQLPINFAKTAVLAAPTAAEKIVQPYLARRGISTARHSKFLGSQIIAGRRRRTPVLQTRIKAAARRLSKAKAMRRAGARMGNPIRAAVTALGVWGATQTGVAETNIRSWRARFFRTHLKLARGASPHLVPLVSKAAAFLDPAAAHHRDIFITWQQLIRDGRVPAAELDMALGIPDKWSSLAGIHDRGALCSREEQAFQRTECPCAPTWLRIRADAQTDTCVVQHANEGR
eukprot:5104552-Amphidinium_carterae.1